VNDTARGLIRAEARGGRVSLIDLDPRMLRLTPADVGSAVRDVVDAALADERERLAAVLVPVADLLSLASAPREPDDQAVLAGHRLDAELRDAFGVDIDDGHLDRLRAEAAELAAPTAAPLLNGVGEHRDRHVRTAVRVVDGAARVDLVEVTYQTLTLPSAELAERLRTSVNSALDEARRDGAATAAPGGPGATRDRADRADRIEQLRAESRRAAAGQLAALGELLAQIRQADPEGV
jgi:hypothetical protein